jgi:hypothetical protein
VKADGGELLVEAANHGQDEGVVGNVFAEFLEGVSLSAMPLRRRQ